MAADLPNETDLGNLRTKTLNAERLFVAGQSLDDTFVDVEGLKATLDPADGNVKLRAVVAGGGEIITPIGDPGSPPALLSSSHTFQPSNPLRCARTSWKYGADNKALLEHVIKLNGPVGDFTAVTTGARVYSRLIQAATGIQTGHVGAETWAVDGALKPGSLGEVPGLWQLQTGTGWTSANSPDPAYYGVSPAIRANSLQQVFLPGQNYARKNITGTLSPNGVGFGSGFDFGACLVLPPGGTSVGLGSVKFDFPNSALLAVPEVGAIESDATGQVFYTDPQAQRGPLRTDRILPCVLAMAGIPGASGTIVNGPNCAIVTVNTGPADQTAGNTFRVNFALANGAAFAFPTGVVPQVTPRDATTSAWAAANQVYASAPAARTGIIIGVPNLKVWPANTTLVFNVAYQGW